MFWCFFFFALQSIFPLLNETPALPGIFASIFFTLILLHSIITSYLYYCLHLHCDHNDTHCICSENSKFWLKWKIIFSFLITSFTVLTVFFVVVAHLLEPSVVDILYKYTHPTPIVVAGATCEYTLVILMILYFCAYLHDLKFVVVTVVPERSVKDDKGENQVLGNHIFPKVVFFK